jgi:hypothetical protein
MTIRPGEYPLYIAKGATFVENFTWKIDNSPVNLTGYSARMQIRSSKLSEEPLISLTTEDDGGIVLGGVAGTIVVSISAEDTSELAGEAGVYDIELEDSSGVVTRLLEGTVKLSNEVTR